MKPKLIVVDDERDMAEFTRDAAIAYGFEASAMLGGEEFLRRCSEECEDCDIVILDLFMPKTDGVEVLRVMAAQNIETSLILMTGKDRHILSSAREMAVELGLTVLGTLQKPFRLLELEEALDRYRGKVTKKASDLPSVGELKEAIANNQLTVAYQPQVSMADRSILGFEALARWAHPDKGMVPPSQFIPLAEQHGLISEITNIVNRIAIAQCGQWRSEGLRHHLSINLSPKILVDLKFPERLEKIVLDNKIAPKDVILEVTETAVTENMAKHIDILTRLRMKGFDLAIDDFGTGYSSLQQLIKVPFNELKIDQAFITNLDTDADCRTIAEISIMLARKLNMRVVAEGIEKEDAWDELRVRGCDIGQGYWIGRPMPAEEIEAWAASWIKG